MAALCPLKQQVWMESEVYIAVTLQKILVPAGNIFAPALSNAHAVPLLKNFFRSAGTFSLNNSLMARGRHRNSNPHGNKENEK